MLSKDSAATPQQPSSPSGADAGEAPLLSPQSPIEVASDGGGTINDPSASDTKPPGISDDLDLFLG